MVVMAVHIPSIMETKATPPYSRAVLLVIKEAPWSKDIGSTCPITTGDWGLNQETLGIQASSDMFWPLTMGIELIEPRIKGLNH